MEDTWKDADRAAVRATGHAEKAAEYLRGPDTAENGAIAQAHATLAVFLELRALRIELGESQSRTAKATERLVTRTRS